MQSNEAFFLAAAVTIPAALFLLYRAIVPYEPVMSDLKLAGSLFYPILLGFGVGLAHFVLDRGLLAGGYAGLAYVFVYPLIETYCVIVVFNRTFFFKQTAAPLYFAVGGAGLGLSLGFIETYGSMLLSGRGAGDAGLLASMAALAFAFVFFHTAKGLLIGSYFVDGARTRAVLLSVAVEVPFGAFYLTGKLGYAPAESLALLLGYGLLVYYYVWHVYFPSHLPDAMRQGLEKERRRQRRVALARRRI